MERVGGDWGRENIKLKLEVICRVTNFTTFSRNSKACKPEISKI